MNLRFVNKLIIDHLRWSGYLLEARILEREFKAKKPNPQSEASKLMNIIENGLQNTGESSASIIHKLMDENDEIDSRQSHQASIVTKNDMNRRTSEQFEPQFKSRGRSLGTKYTDPKDTYVTRNSVYQRSESDHHHHQQIGHSSNITNIAKILREQKRNSSLMPIQNQPEVDSRDQYNESLNNTYSHTPERFAEKQRLPPKSTPNGYVEILPKNYLDTQEEERGNNYHNTEDQTPHSLQNYNTWDGHSNTSTMLPTRQNSQAFNPSNTSFLQKNNSKNSYYSDSNFIKKSANNKRQSFASTSAQSEHARDYRKAQAFHLEKQKTSMSHQESEVWNHENHHSLNYSHQSQNSSFITQKPQKSSLNQNYAAFLADPQKRVESVPPSAHFKPPSHKSLIDGFISSEKKDTLPLLKEKRNVNISPFEAEPENKNNFKNEPFVSLQPKEMGNFKRVYQPIAYAPRTKIDKSQSFTTYQNDQPSSKNVQRQFSNPNPQPVKLGFTKEQSPFGRSVEPSGGFQESLKSPVQTQGYEDHAAPADAYSHDSKIDAKILEYLVSSTSINEIEIKAYFKVYASLVPNRKNPMDKSKFRDFVSRIRNMNGDHFLECLFDNGHELGLVRDAKFIEFKDAVVILDRLNQDNPFSIMNFIFKIAGQENPSISLIETILRDVRPANTKGRISILLDSLEFIYAQTKLQRADSLQFEQYLQVIKNFEPIRKYC